MTAGSNPHLVADLKGQNFARLSDADLDFLRRARA